MLIGALAFCAAAQIISFIPFWIAYKQDIEEYGNDLGAPLAKRFAVWLVMFPVWAIPLAAMIGE